MTIFDNNKPKIRTVENLFFSETEVILSDEFKTHRKERLYFAMIVGNSQLKPARLKVIDNSGEEAVVEVIVKAISNDKIIIDKGLSIPICAIKEVEVL